VFGMSKPEARGKRARMFVALDLPKVVREEIGSWGEKELADPALRRVEPESLHVTLAFLGNRPSSDIGPIAAVVRACGRPAPEIRLEGPEQRPLRGRARVFALPVRSAAVMAIQADLQAGLVRAGLHASDKQPFWPHVTVARVRDEGHGGRRPALVANPPKTAPVQASFKAVRLTFYRSELQPRGARYVPLAQVELPGTRQQ
jgi:2'-5' RNA ligase